MKHYLKPLFTIILFTIVGIYGTAQTDLDSLYGPDTGYIEDELTQALRDSLIIENKELQIYFYHVNALMEYQAFQIKQYRSIIYFLLGAIALIITILLLKKVSKKYERNVKLTKVKKQEMVPASVLKTILLFWKVKDPLKNIAPKFEIKEGEVADLKKFMEVSETYNLSTELLKITIKDLVSLLEFPIIVMFQNHMAILYRAKGQKLMLADPYYGYLEMDPYYFANNWFIDKEKELGVAIAIYENKVTDKKIVKWTERLEKMSKLEKRFWKNYHLW